MVLLICDVKDPVVGGDQAQLFPGDVFHEVGVVAVFDGVGELGVVLDLLGHLLGEGLYLCLSGGDLLADVDQGIDHVGQDQDQEDPPKKTNLF